MKPAQFPPLRSLEEALAQLLAAAQPLDEYETISTFDGDGRVLAEDLLSPLDVPGFDNSQMDGYAMKSDDIHEAGAVLSVSQRIPAGHFGEPLEAMSAARIFTGAPMPVGADCVVMQEDCTALDDGRVQVNVAPKVGQWMRLRGEDVKLGARSLSKGERLSPAALGLAASLGFEKLQVHRPVRVALFSTGDELVMPGVVAPQDMKPGSIYNSNRFFLRALLLRAGCEIIDAGIVPDQIEATMNVLRDTAPLADLILTSGGVSVGEEDHIKPAVQANGRLDLWSISMKPGKPFAYGCVNRASGGFAHFVGLPGNPVSSLVTFMLLVRPLLARLAGQSGDLTAIYSISLRADFTCAKADQRREFLRVKRNATGGLDLFPNQNSSVLTSCVWADGLVDVPAGHKVIEGDIVRFIPFSELL
jgi:molybdopterin molybdotransferase